MCFNAAKRISLTVSLRSSPRRCASMLSFIDVSGSRHSVQRSLWAALCDAVLAFLRFVGLVAVGNRFQLPCGLRGF
jgi:hypothetical protein